MDPLGFGLENFDAIGGWREKDGTFPVDASGDAARRQDFNGPDELKEILLANRDAFTAGHGGENDDLRPRAAARTGRPAGYQRAIARRVARSDYRFSSAGARHRQQRAVSTKEKETGVCHDRHPQTSAAAHIPARNRRLARAADIGLHDAGLRWPRGKSALRLLFTYIPVGANMTSGRRRARVATINSRGF